MAAAYVGLYVPAPGTRSRRFGALNAAALLLVFGLSAAGLLLALALVLWLILRPVQRLRAANRERTVNVLGIAGLVLVSAIFVFSKVSYGRELGPGPLGAAYQLLRLVAFSYVFLRGVDLVRCVVWGRERLLDPLALAGYLGPFHMLLSGPITPYADWVAADTRLLAAPTFRRLVGAANLVVLGLVFKVVIAQSMRLFLFGMTGPIGAASWLETAYLTVYLYFDFAGYSLVALGIGVALDTPTPRNFNKPFLAPSVTAFWTSWHMSLSTFVRNNVFLPLQLQLARRLRRRAANVVAIVPLAASFCAAGMWHRFSMRFLVWGAAMGLIMGVEKLVRDRLMREEWFRRGLGGRVLRLIGPAYALSVVVTGLYFVAAEIFG